MTTDHDHGLTPKMAELLSDLAWEAASMHQLSVVSNCAIALAINGDLTCCHDSGPLPDAHPHLLRVLSEIARRRMRLALGEDRP